MQLSGCSPKVLPVPPVEVKVKQGGREDQTLLLITSQHLLTFIYFGALASSTSLFLSSSESGSEEAVSTAEPGEDKEQEDERSDVENGAEASGLVPARIPGSRRLESDSD